MENPCVSLRWVSEPGAGGRIRVVIVSRDRGGMMIGVLVARRNEQDIYKLFLRRPFGHFVLLLGLDASKTVTPTYSFPL